jgi:site-specific recombinase XerD
LCPIGSGDKEQLMSTTAVRPALANPLAAFEEYLARTRGVCPGTRHNYITYAGAFLEAVTAGAAGAAGEIGPREVAEFVRDLTGRYETGTVCLAASALRSFFRFLQIEGLCGGDLAEAVPMVPRRRTGLVRHLQPEQFEQLLASLATSSLRDLRDRAIILCIARLGLRASEVAALRLEDIDWQSAVIRVRARKTGHGAVLPLPAEVGSALAAWLQYGRRGAHVREVFVLVRWRPGAPVSHQVVGRAVDRALQRAGVAVPAGRANLLRHSLATQLLDHGASLHQIAGVLGHQSLATTRMYAAVDVAALREVALPWLVTS